MAAASPANGNGSGKSPEGAINMEQLVQDMMRQPFFREVLKEWVGQVENEDDSTAFTNMFMEWMRDEGPNGHESRKACTMFANFMKRRDWAAMLAVMDPILDADQRRIFATPHAEEFYESFRAMVLYAVKEYWYGFARQMHEAEQAKAQARTGGAPASAPAPAAAGAPAPEAPPIPQREAPPASAASAASRDSEVA
jgi:hypothetical protein